MGVVVFLKPCTVTNKFTTNEFIRVYNFATFLLVESGGMRQDWNKSVGESSKRFAALHRILSSFIQRAQMDFHKCHFVGFAAISGAKHNVT